MHVYSPTVRRNKVTISAGHVTTNDMKPNSKVIGVEVQGRETSGPINKKGGGNNNSSKEVDEGGVVNSRGN